LRAKVRGAQQSISSAAKQQEVEEQEIWIRSRGAAGSGRDEVFKQVLGWARAELASSMGTAKLRAVWSGRTIGLAQQVV